MREKVLIVGEFDVGGEGESFEASGCWREVWEGKGLERDLKVALDAGNGECLAGIPERLGLVMDRRAGRGVGRDLWLPL